MKNHTCSFQYLLVRHRLAGMVLSLAVSSLVAQTAPAANWVGTTDQNWNTFSNWGSSPSTVNDTVNVATGNYPVISSEPTFTPVDLFVGDGAGTAGRIDQSTGTLALANTGVNGNWMFVGLNTGTGTYNLTGNGSLAVGKLWIGGEVYGENGTGTVTVNTTGTLQANSTDDFTNWGQYQTSLSVGWGSFPSGPANGTLNLVQGTINTPNRAIYVGAWGSTGTVNQSGGTINTNGLEVGRWFSTLATVNVTGGTLNSAFVNVARTGQATDVSRAVLNVNGGGVLNSEGDLAVAVGGSGAGGGYGQVNIGAGGTVNVASTVERWMIVNQFDTTPGTVNVTGGTLNLNAGTDLRYSTANSTGAGTVNLTSGAITGGAGSVIDLNNNVSSGGNNQFNLNGGVLTIGQIITNNNGNTVAFNFNGGTLKAAAATSALVDLGGASQTANVQVGGATIDSNGFDITIPQPLLTGSAAGGGLTKAGLGALTLGGVNTFTGNTTVNAGSLVLADNAALRGAIGANGVNNQVNGG
ncbi:MAG: autotransporter-associated beta strand repeat-containing protein, partial [Pirellulales bacterium]